MHARGFNTGQKTMENQDWATGPPGRRAVAGRGPVFSKIRYLLIALKSVYFVLLRVQLGNSLVSS